MHLYLVRHGQSVGNVHFVVGQPRLKTEPLTELGIEQARQAAKTIKAKTPKPTKIISSPYTRAQQTADVIAKELGLEVSLDDRLGEYNPGDWDGRHKDDFTQEFGKLKPEERHTFRPPGGESWLDEAERVRAVIEDARQNGQTCLVLVSHYDPIKAVVSFLTKDAFEDWDAPIEYPPGSVIILDDHDGGWQCVRETA
jgi:glucosyl-3-phosphoglycerate phosphatase